MKKLILMLICVACAGCVTRPASKQTDVSPEQFLALYGLPEVYWKLDTRFTESLRYYYIDLYTFKMASWTEYDRSWRIRKSEIDGHFKRNSREVFTDVRLTPEQQQKLNSAIRRVQELGINLPSPLIIPESNQDWLIFRPEPNLEFK